MSSHINTFIDYCRKLEDPRVPGLITYPLEEMLLLSLCGILSGHNDWHDISYWGEHKLLWLREFLPYASGIPTATTLTRVFNSLDSKSFQKIFEHLGIKFRYQPIKKTCIDRWQGDKRI